MKAPVFLVFLLIFQFPLAGRAVSESQWSVPANMTFCGIELTLTPGARAEIQKTVDKLTVKPEYHQELKRRISVFMPWVEDALKRCGMPEDLKYLVIQESAFVGDAVSSSNAVGFWQFKDFTAREMGLTINGEIDERKHLYKSTLAAAKYFYQNNRYFDNYLYSVIAYYAGGGGSMAYIDPSLFGARKMTLDSNFHWYPLKALAHKIVFEKYIESAPIPEVWLEAHYLTPGKTLTEICAEWTVHPDSFRKYNLWMVGSRTPQTGKTMVGFIPRKPAGLMSGSPLHNGRLPEIQPGFAGPEIPVFRAGAPVSEGRVGSPYHHTPMLWDDGFRAEYIWIEKPLSPQQAAAAGGIQADDFLAWNPQTAGLKLLPPNTWYRKTDPREGNIWVTTGGENWAVVAEACDVPEKKLKKLNRVKPAQNKALPAGLRVELREKGPKEPILLDPPEKLKGKKDTEYYSPTANQAGVLPRERSNQPVVCVPEGKGVVCQVSMPEAVQPFPAIRGNWVTHEVRKGEEVWLLAKKYDTRSDLIRKVNQLGSNRIRPGMKLRVFLTENI